MLPASTSVERQIISFQNDPTYLTGIGEAKSVADARGQAEKALVSRIQVSIGVTTNSSANYLENDRELKVSTEYSVQNKSFAGMFLRGLSYLEEHKNDESWTVLAYIERDSVASSFALRKSRIVSLTNTGSGAVERGSIGDGLKDLYQAWLLAQFYPDTVDLRAAGLGNSTNPKVALHDRINQILGKMEIKVDDCYRDDPLVMAPLRFNFDGKPVKDLTISYYGGQGTEFARVLDGKADLPLVTPPTMAEQKLLVTFEFAFETDLQTDPELSGLFDMFGAGDFQNIALVTIHFPWIKSDNPHETKPETVTSLISLPTTTATRNDTSESEPISVLKRLSVTADFLDVLGQYARLGVVRFGRKSDFGDGSGCHVAVIGEDRVEAFLYFDGINFHSPDTNLIEDLSKNYHGKRQVWIKELRASQ